MTDKIKLPRTLKGSHKAIEALTSENGGLRKDVEKKLLARNRAMKERDDGVDMLDRIAVLLFGRDWANNFGHRSIEGELAQKLVELRGLQVKNDELEQKVSDFYQLLRSHAKDPTLVIEAISHAKKEHGIEYKIDLGPSGWPFPPSRP